MLPWKWLTSPGCQGPWATIRVVSKLKGKEGGNFKGSLKFWEKTSDQTLKIVWC